MYSYYIMYIHCESKIFSITSPNIDRISKLFYRQIQQEIHNRDIIKDFTTPQMCCYTTL